MDAQGNARDDRAGRTKDAREEADARARNVVIYCDGACRGNPGVGGYGAVLRCEYDEKELSGAAGDTTNNRMELTAAIEALAVLSERCSVRIVTDSQYLKNGITEWIHNWRRKGWKTSRKKKVLNRDLWERLLELCERHEIRWEWVPGHAGHLMNERCDRLANQAIDCFLLETSASVRRARAARGEK